jgi:Phytanoyl-CoA dioxygenase (PhyH)
LVVDDLLGRGNWKKPRNWGGFLVSFPDTGADDWNVPSGYWHVDFHFTHDPQTPFGIRVFSFLSQVPPRGGGTLVVAGSHVLVSRFVSRVTDDERALGFAKLRDRLLASDSWFGKLTQPAETGDDRVRFFMEQQSVVDGVAVRVEQLCGQAGDVVVMHPWLVHAPSPHAGTGPRFMLAKDLFAASGPAEA